MAHPPPVKGLLAISRDNMQRQSYTWSIALNRLHGWSVKYNVKRQKHKLTCHPPFCYDMSFLFYTFTLIWQTSQQRRNMTAELFSDSYHQEKVINVWWLHGEPSYLIDKQPDLPGPSFIKPSNFTSNYTVYWSQLTAIIQCSLQLVSCDQFSIRVKHRRRIDLSRSRWGILHMWCL